MRILMPDITMPEMTGEEFTRKPRENPDPGCRNIPFIVITGGTGVDASLRYSFRGNSSCRAFLPKMTKPNDVVLMVQNILVACD